MNSERLSFALVAVIIFFLISNFLTFQALRREQTKSGKVLSLLEETPARYQEQIREYVGARQQAAGETFGEMIENMTLFRKMAAESEAGTRALLEQRRDYLKKMGQDLPVENYWALEIIKLDGEIIRAFQDYAELEAMHRKRLIDKLRPLASELGIDGP